MKFFCWFGVHTWNYGPVYVGKPNGCSANYHVQNKTCSCCGKSAVVFAGRGLL